MMLKHYNELFDAAVDRGFSVEVENREGILLLIVVIPGFGVAAMWPAVDGSLDRAAQYAMHTFRSIYKR